MNHDEIIKARKNYKQRLKDREELLLLKQELEELIKDPNVKRYVELCGLTNKTIPSDEDIIKHSFSGVSKTKTDFIIYLYMGAFKCSGVYDDGDYQVFNIDEADYLLYQNLENESDQPIVKPSAQEKFEKKNIVLKCRTIKAGSKYYELQNALYKEFLTGDLRSKEKILERVKEHL